MNKAAKSLPASKLTRFVQEFIYLDSNSATCQRPWLVISNSQRRNLSHVHPRGIPYFWPCMGCFSRRKSYHGVIITFLKLVICCFPKIRRYFQMVVCFFGFFRNIHWRWVGQAPYFSESPECLGQFALTPVSSGRDSWCFKWWSRISPKKKVNPWSESQSFGP